MIVFNSNTSAPELQSKTANPSTTQQVIKPDEDYIGLSQVTVQAATLQTKNVTPSNIEQTITPDNGYYGLSEVVVEAVDDKQFANLGDFPDTLTLKFDCTARQGCGTAGHGCSASGSIKIFTSIYNYITVNENKKFNGISTGPCSPFTTLTATYNSTSSDKGNHDGINIDPASLVVTLSRV